MAPVTAAEHTSTPRAAVDVPKKPDELKRDGRRLVEAIVANDSTAVQSFFGDFGVTLGAHSHATGHEIRRQFESKTGLVYAMFFDTAQLLRIMAASFQTPGAREWPSPKSLRESFGTADRVAIDVQDIVGHESGPLWARLVLRWPERPHPAFYLDPSFVFTDAGWKFQSFFTDP